MVLCEGRWDVRGGGVTAQELICLSLKGQQESGLSCPDGRWPLWRQSRVKLLPGPFENISVLLEWLAIWASVPSSNPPLCQAWGMGGMSGKHGSFPQLLYSSYLVSSVPTLCPNKTTSCIFYGGTSPSRYTQRHTFTVSYTSRTKLSSLKCTGTSF